MIACFSFFFFFFFSSRRRHTRCSRDWSSDVCSSDLDVRGGLGLRPPAVADEEEDGSETHRGGHHEGGEDDEVVQLVEVARERRRLVGQEEQPAEDLVHAAFPFFLISRHQSAPRSATSPVAKKPAP